MSAKTRSFVVALLVLLCAAATVFFDWKEGEDLLIQRKYQAAAEALEKGLPEAAVGDRDRVLLLLGRARLLAGQHDAALAAFRQMLAEQPGSALVHQARFQEARALEKSGKVREAAQIYRGEIERLIGLDRKEEVATTYLGLAEKAMGSEPPDRARAVTFYDLALDLGLSPSRAKAVRLKAAELDLQGGQPQRAAQRYEALVGELTEAEGKLRAMLGLGQARRTLGDRPGARTVLRDLRALAPESPEAADAAYEIALCYGVPTPQVGELDRAVGALRELASRHPNHPKAKVSLFLQAQCYRHVGRTEDALAALKGFLAAAGDQAIDEVPAARAMVGDVLLAQNRPADAIAAFRDYLRLHPAHGEWERVQRAIVDTEYGMAAEAYLAGKERFEEARERFGAFARTYPLDERNPDILYALGDMLLQEEKFDEAREAFARVVSKYPGKDASSRAQYAIGQIFETKAFNYQEALKAYQAVTWGPAQNPARQRIALLTRKHLHLRTERIFRTDEKPTFQLTSRNIEKVRVRVFRLDLEDYFRATHSAGEVQRLDIEVIEADKTFDSAVPEYQKHRETERAVEIGFQAPGAYVVKVDDRELEATTMVLVSDLALIAKSSRHECFVLTQNTKENRVEGGVKVVLSDGSKVLAEGQTGADGAWRFQGKELQNLDDLRVFAVNAAGSGASSVSLSGLGFGQGLTAKGYLFTDRPAYQPGQRVHWKGIVREVDGGVYRLPAGEWLCQVWSSGGRLMLQRAVQFSAFGSFAMDLDLPADAELGGWRIVCGRSRTDLPFAAEFTVARYERPRLNAEIVLEQPVVFRGETIKGRIKATYFFGEPAAGREVVYGMQLPDGGVQEHKGSTNAAGEVPFQFDTKEFGEEAMAVLWARLPADGVNAQTAVPVVTTEFAPTLATVRNVYLVKEPFDVAVTLLDRSGKPLARELTAVLLRLEERGGKARPAQRRAAELHEVEVARKTFTTDAKGKGTVGFAAEKGGQHRVRIEGKDRFDNLVTAELQLTISGDDDEVKLRLLSDAETYKVGDTLSAKVANRAGARLCLVTVQGDGILTYETRVLPAGESTLSVPLLPLHAPNFALSLAMIDGNSLHQAERQFRVLRDLSVAVTVPGNSAAPGSEVEVQVRALDPQGKPVSAEVALALVDEALLSVYADGTPKMSEYFYGSLRETAFRCVSSCTWAYDGPSRRMSEALLAEEVRRELERHDAQPAATEGDDGGRRYAGPGDMVPSPGGGAGGGRGRLTGPTTGGPAGPIAGGRPGQRRSQNGVAADPAGQAQQEVQQQLEGNSDFFLGAAVRTVAFDKRADLKKLAEFKAGQDVLRDLSAGQQLAGFALVDAVDGLAAVSRPSDQPRTNFSETGAWLSAVTTDAEGRATAKIRLPDSTTGWRLQARGVTADTWVGEGQATLRTHKDLQADLVGPRTLTEGDESQVIARVHNLTAAAVPVDLELVTTRGGERTAAQARVQVGAQTEAEARFPLLATSASDLQLGLGAKGAGLADELAQAISVRPFGVEFRAGRAGATGDRASFQLGLPEGREFTALQMLVEVGPDPGRDLLTAALGHGYRPRNCVQLDVTGLARASRGLSALLALDYLERAGSGNPADTARLLGQAQAMLQALLSTQLQDGSLPWAGKSNQDLRSTCQALRFFARCRARGLAAAEQPMDKAAEWLLQYLRNAGNEQRADVLWALAAADRARFEALNSLHRSRNDLSVDAMARLALAWLEHKRPELAGEVLDGLRPKVTAATFGRLSLEAVALAATALLRADARDALGAEAAAFVQQQRQGASWATPEATAAAIGLASLARAPAAGPGKTGVITVTVNGRELAKLPAGSTASSAWPVPADWLQERGNQVSLVVEGGGEAHYAVNLTGFARGFRAEDKNRDVVRVERKYLADARRHGTQTVQQGFSVVDGTGYRTFENRVTQLRVGEITRVHVSHWIPREELRRTMTPLLVEEPLPAGCTVLRDSIRGAFDHVEVLPDRLQLYYREGVTGDTFSYELQARFPGKYRALPTMVQGAQRPELLAYGETGELTVHAAGQGNADDYRLTPDELFHLGRMLFEEGEKAAGDAARQAFLAAAGHFDQLLADWHKKDFYLRDHVFKEVARMMLFLSIERGDSRSVVRFFEALKDRYPDLVIPFDRILAVGKAYVDLGEFEAALLVFRATADASFLKEAAVATTLEGLGELQASVQFLQRLLRAYPDLNTMRASAYGIGQRLAALAAGLNPTAPVDERIGAPGALRLQAIAVLREFLVMFPEDPLAEEVSFAWATTLLEHKDLEGALRVAEAALQRYPDSTFVDELLYTVGYAQFALGRHEAAFATLKRVAEEQFPDGRGGKGPSESRYHAIYLQGQIHHARNEPEQALAAYKTVEDRFSDAGEAMHYFLRKQLGLPEVSSFAMAESPQLTIAYRNVAKVQVQVFRVDLMRLYLLEKSLNDIRGIQLHGIKPMRSLEVELGQGRDYRGMEKKVPLELAEPGAYLVVIRGGDLLASGMILRTDLKIEAQESFDIGRIRVNVKQGEAFVSDAHVKVVGSGDQAFQSGDTDLRGVFAAESLVGLATVIVKKGDQYAFYRGTGVHQAQRYRPAPEPQPQQDGPAPELRKGRKFDALEQNMMLNEGNRSRQVEWLKNEVMNKQQTGVEVYRTK